MVDIKSEKTPDIRLEMQPAKPCKIDRFRGRFQISRSYQNLLFEER